MAHVRIEQKNDEMYPRVVVAETGDRLFGIASVSYGSSGDEFAELTIVFAVGTFEVCIDLDERWQKSHTEDAPDATP